MNKYDLYFLKQRLYGVVILALAVLSTFICDGDATACVILIPIGLAALFSKEMVLVNEYFFEVAKEDEEL